MPEDSAMPSLPYASNEVGAPKKKTNNHEALSNSQKYL